MVVGVVPKAGAQPGPGLSLTEAEAHMSMWVMAASLAPTPTPLVWSGSSLVFNSSVTCLLRCV